jgi:hypothetical protein
MTGEYSGVLRSSQNEMFVTVVNAVEGRAARNHQSGRLNSYGLG